MKNIIKEFLSSNNICLNGQNICIGVSTGVDSTVLLHCLMDLKEELQFNIILCHVNHKKRMQSEYEEQYIKQFSLDNDLILEVLHLNNEEIENDNFQKAAREKRLQFFNEIMDKYDCDYLFLAHHLNDDMETSFMHIIRGSSLKGYSGIRPITYSKNNKVILRPFLKTLKKDILEYALNNNIKYFEDESNNSYVYTRNRVRHNIIPLLFEENSNFSVQYNQYKETLYNAYLIVNEKRDSFIKQYVCIKDNVISFNIKDYFELSQFMQVEVLFELLKDFELSRKNIDEINSYIYSKKANLYLTYKGILFNKKYDVIEMKKYEKCNNDMISIVIDDIGVYNINDHYELEVKKFDKEELKKNKNLLINSNVIWYNSSKLPLVLRNRIAGDRIKINDGTKKIKDLLIDEKIPADLRDKLLLLEKDNEVLNVFGIRKSQTLIDSKNNDILITLREKK